MHILKNVRNFENLKLCVSATCQDKKFGSLAIGEGALEFEKILMIFKEHLNIIIHKQPPEVFREKRCS